MSASEFGQLLVGQSEHLRPFAFSLTRNSESASDLYQETMCRALQNKEKYQAGTNMKAWVLTIMRNIFINNYRRTTRYRVVPEPEAGFAEHRFGTISNGAEDAMSCKLISAHIRKLPTIFHFPFIMYIEGYKYHEIAGIVNEPLGTIKSRIHFARKILKEQILRDETIKN